jgi:hypothetical protein
MRKFIDPRSILAWELLTVYSVPNVQAHLSAFSSPVESYQAFSSGSVTDSSSSCAMTDAMASADGSPFGLLAVWIAQLPRLGPFASPTNENFTFVPL